MGDLSPNFSRYEFKCKCGHCSQVTVDSELVTSLEILRAALKGPSITITSGNRCPGHNKEVGGRPKSYHLLSQAADIVAKGVDPATVYRKLDILFPDKYGLGDGSTFTHLDIRPTHVRWTY